MVRRAATPDAEGPRKGQPRRLDQILAPALGRLATSDEAKAYGAWARASGDQVAGGARPRNFSRGTLTVECTSSVWANELTYLGGQLMSRMDAMAPGHPVKRLRFTVARSRSGQEDQPAASKDDPCRKPPAPSELDGARAQAEGVRDERLRAAIDAVLHAPTEGSAGPPGEHTPQG
jgi:predicted nucleic acid-binding Zn ribbon protein